MIDPPTECIHHFDENCLEQAKAGGAPELLTMCHVNMTVDVCAEPPVTVCNMTVMVDGKMINGTCEEMERMAEMY